MNCPVGGGDGVKGKRGGMIGTRKLGETKIVGRSASKKRNQAKTVQ